MWLSTKTEVRAKSEVCVKAEGGPRTSPVKSEPRAFNVGIKDEQRARVRPSKTEFVPSVVVARLWPGAGGQGVVWVQCTAPHGRQACLREWRRAWEAEARLASSVSLNTARRRLYHI
eukprot:NODE_23519_length_663_cov_1.347015.p2 GENE.NODE_23519_length_663_cov_1.347015~~NODE_23519_length_663_cov_1.347015.p2  ORF type:complete len:117 (-),score=15.55 NODE_23519_length_663_cov_1.347015:159-509(-)